jgi:hypothetical protein
LRPAARKDVDGRAKPGHDGEAKLGHDGEALSLRQLKRLLLRRA